MSRITICLLSVGLLAAAGVGEARSAPAETVTKDSKGRVTSRTTKSDEGGHRTFVDYVADSERPSSVTDEDLDRSGRVTRRVEQRFDAQGRIHEKVEVSFDESGKKTGFRTRYSYDPVGGRTEALTPVR
jgi:hypothetical protein